MSRDIAHAQWRLSIVSMSTWGLGDNISEPVRDRYLDPINHQYEMAYWDSNGHGTVDVTWPRKVKVGSNIFGAHYFDNGWGYGLGANGAPIRNGYLGIKWSRDRRRRVTQRGQGLDRNMLRVQYLERGWKYRLGDNEAPAGNGVWRVEWSRDRWRHLTLKDRGRDHNMFGAHYLENGWG